MDSSLSIDMQQEVKNWILIKLKMTNLWAEFA